MIFLALFHLWVIPSDIAKDDQGRIDKFFHLDPALITLSDLGVDNLSLDPQIGNGVVKISPNHLAIFTNYGALIGGSANLFISLVKFQFRLQIRLVRRVLLHLLTSLSLFFLVVSLKKMLIWPQRI